MSRNDTELQDLAAFAPGVMITRWKIKELLDEGGFGRVYKVENQEKKSQFAALKVESTNMEGGSAIKLEDQVLKQVPENIQDEFIRAHVPTLFRSAKRRRNCCYMIVTLLGDSLKKIKDKRFPKGFPERTWIRIGIQCLFALKVVHESGFVHRDLKPANFVMGHRGDPTRARIVHIIDFGLAREYAIHDKKEGIWTARKSRSNLDFRGTQMYAAPSMHDGQEQGRKDDIFSFVYLLIDLYKELPWGNCESNDDIAQMKKSLKDEELLKGMPGGLLPILTHVRKLTVYSRPNYGFVYECLKGIMAKNNVTWLDSYEWETKEEAEANRKYCEKNADKGYMNSQQFLNEDCIRMIELVAKSDKNYKEKEKKEKEDGGGSLKNRKNNKKATKEPSAEVIRTMEATAEGSGKGKAKDNKKKPATIDTTPGKSPATTPKKNDAPKKKDPSRMKGIEPPKKKEPSRMDSVNAEVKTPQGKSPKTPEKKKNKKK